MTAEERSVGDASNIEETLMLTSKMVLVLGVLSIGVIFFLNYKDHGAVTGRVRGPNGEVDIHDTIMFTILSLICFSTGISRLLKFRRLNNTIMVIRSVGLIAAGVVVLAMTIIFRING